MESSFLFFFVGVIIFISSLLSEKWFPQYKFLFFFISGFLGGGIIGMVVGSSIVPGIQISWVVMVIIGGGAGAILYTAEKLKIFSLPGIQYFATIILGLILAGFSYGLIVLYTTLSSIEHETQEGKMLIFFILVLSGFLTVFGYSFPKRWFQRRKSINN